MLMGTKRGKDLGIRACSSDGRRTGRGACKNGVELII